MTSTLAKEKGPAIIKAPTQLNYDDLKNWTLVKKENNVNVFKMDGLKEGLIAFRGVTNINTPLQRLYSMIRNDKLWPLWVEAFSKGHYIETKKENQHYIVYQALDLPIVSDRDVVFESKISWDNRSLIITNKSVKHPKSPKSVGIRADMILSKWRLTPISSKKTRLDLIALTDVKGSIPNWLVNIAQKQYVVSVLDKLKSVLKTNEINLVSLPHKP